jgi:Tol biopolymer transport system component
MLSTDFGIAYMPSQVSGTGQVLFLRDQTLMAQRFDDRRLERMGQEAAVADHVGFIYGVNGYFSASKNGTLVFRSGSLQMQQLAWFDRKGKPAGALDASGASCSGLALSPDGSRAAVSWLDSQAPQYLDLWLFDFGNGRKTRFTSGGYSYSPIWSSDGSLVVFRMDRGDFFGLYQKLASGARQEELLLKSKDKVVIPACLSRDGRFLLYSVENSGVNNDLWVLPLEGERKPIPFVNTEFNETNGRFSPDMRWIAYESNETGITEIYVRAFLENSAGSSAAAGGGVIVSKGGGFAPRWRKDTRELYYRVPDGRVMAVAIASGTQFDAGTPAPLFNAPFAGGYWDAASDGERFLLLTPLIESKPSPFNVILNWTSSLKK